MTFSVPGDDPESCDECGTRGCVLRPIQLDDGDHELVCGSCFIDLDRDLGVDRVNWRAPPTESSSRIELREFDPVGSGYEIVDPDNPRHAYLYTENALDLANWQ